MVTTAIIRLMLVVDIIGLALLALLYLRQRQMSRFAYLRWGFLAVAVPVIGPFVVIASRPGKWDPSFSPRNDVVRFLKYMRRLLPDQPPSPAHSRSRQHR
jgi:hypothetical protein